MKLFGKMFLCFICFNLTLMPLMAENAFDYKDSEQIDSEKKNSSKDENVQYSPTVQKVVEYRMFSQNGNILASLMKFIKLG